MATSGSYDFSLTASQLMTTVAKNLGVIGAGASLSSADSADMLVKLNLMLKQFQGTADGTPGIKVHTRQRVTLFLNLNQRVYNVGPAGTDDKATLLYGAAASGAASNSRVQRFVSLESALLRYETETDVPLRVYTDAREYDQGISSKFASGTPTSILVEPLRLNTRITLNSEPVDSTKQVVMTVLYPQEDCDSASDDLSLPQEWLGFLEWELTLRCCPMFGKTWSPDMEKNHSNSKMLAVALNPENSTLYFQCGGH